MREVVPFVNEGFDPAVQATYEKAREKFATAAASAKAFTKVLMPLGAAFLAVGDMGGANLITQLIHDVVQFKIAMDIVVQAMPANYQDIQSMEAPGEPSATAVSDEVRNIFDEMKREMEVENGEAES